MIVVVPADTTRTTDSYKVTDRTRLRRHAERGTYDRDVVHAILDEAIVAHVGAVTDGRTDRPADGLRPHRRVDLPPRRGGQRTCSAPSRTEHPCCVTVTLLDGLVLARSEFHHSMNFRCVVVQGDGERVDDPDEKRRMSAALVDHLVDRSVGRDPLAHRRPSSARRSRCGSRWSRSRPRFAPGPPIDEPTTSTAIVWAGVIPIEWVRGTGIRMSRRRLSRG